MSETSNSNNENRRSNQANDEGPGRTSEQAASQDNGSTSAGSEGGNRANTRNVTVAIQYSWLNDMRNLGGALAGGGADGDNQDRPQGPGSGENGDTFVLSFTDVPDSTSNDRFQEVIGIAAQFALSRVARRFSLLQGLSKESFEKLPLKEVNEVGSDLCSICYEGFEDEVSSISRGLKRYSSDSEDLAFPSTKRQRVIVGDTPNPPPGLTRDANVVNPDSTMQRDARINEPHDPNQNGETGENEAEQPVYRHSPTELPCGHIFGRDCIFRWTQEHNSCPICRARIVENDGLNHAVHDTPVGMDEFDRQSFERIRQLIYGENATNVNGGADGGITLQRHNVIVIRPDSAIFAGNAERANNGGEANAPATNNDAPSTSGQDTSRGETEVQNPMSQRHFPEGVEALGVIPLALFSLAPSGIRREAEPRNNQTAGTNGEGAVNPGAGTSTTPTTGSNPGPGSLPMNSSDINRIFDIIANLTDRIQPRRSENTSVTDTNLSGQESEAVNGPRPDATNGASSAQTGGSRFRLFDFLGRRRRLRNLAQNGAANAENTNHINDTNTTNSGGSNTATNSRSPVRADAVRGAFSEVERNLLGGSRNLFSTGVASFRDASGVTTVDITGDMPHRASSTSTSSESSNDNNESSNS